MLVSATLQTVRIVKKACFRSLDHSEFVPIGLLPSETDCWRFRPDIHRAGCKGF